MTRSLFGTVRRWRLRTRLMALSIAVMIPGFVILGITEFNIARSRDQEVRSLAARSANQAASEVARIIDGVAATMRTVSRAPAVFKFKEPECSDYLGDVQRSFPSITGIIALDTFGNFRCGSLAPAVGTNFADRDYFKRALSESGAALGTYTIGENSGKQVLPVALAIHGANGETLGVVMAGLDLLWLGQQLRERALPEDGSLMVADKTGTILARIPAPEKFIGTRVPESFMPRINSTSPGVTEATGLDGTVRMLGFMPPAAQDDGLYVSVGLSIVESYKSVRQSLAYATYTAIVWAAATLAITWLFGNRLFVRPVSKLVSVIRKWRKGDHSVRTGLSNDSGELNRLGMELDRMIDQIVQDQSDKQLLTDELMHRIKNTLSMVSALAMSTMNKPEPAKELLPAFLKRIHALAETADILHAKHWRGADLEKLVRAVTSPLLIGTETKARITGPEVHLSPREAFGMTLVIHELCTNAAKHGALRVPEGRIDVQWTSQDGKLEVEWSESGMEGVTVPTRQGFGTKLMTRAFNSAGIVQTHFLPTGLRCEISVELGIL